MGTIAQQIIKTKNIEIIFHTRMDGYPDYLGEETLNICSRFKKWNELKSFIENLKIKTLKVDKYDNIKKEEAELLGNDLKDFLVSFNEINIFYNPPIEWIDLDYKYIIDLDNNFIEFYKNINSDNSTHFELFLKVDLSDIQFYYDFDKLMEHF